MKRILALDVGKRRIGIAISDPLAITTRPHSTIDRNKNAVSTIAAIVRELEVKKIIVGLPLHLSGKEGEQAQDARTFAAKLTPEVAPVEIEFWDERLSTVEAEQRLASRAREGKRARGLVDAVAAALILESYLNEKA